MKLRIVPDPMLRAKAKKISRIDASVQRLADDMIDTMHVEGGVGLAANQVGVLKRLIVIEIPEVDTEARVYINPEIMEKEGERRIEEGCLSVPGYRGFVVRAEQVKVKALDRHGKPLKVKADGLLAQALEHEIDHLNGILYVDHVKAHEDLWKIEKGEQEPTPEDRTHQSFHQHHAGPIGHDEPQPVEATLD